MKLYQKAIAVSLSLAMVLSLAACDLGGGKKDKDKKKNGDDDAVITVADDFSSALTSRKASKLIKLCDEDAAEDLEDTLEEDLDFGSRFGGDKGDICEAIADSMSYEVDEDSVEIDDEEATVDVVFEMVDYNSLLDEDFASADDFIDEVNSSKETIEVKLTLELELVDDEWVVTNAADIIEDAFPFIDEDFEFDGEVDLVGAFDYSIWNPIKVNEDCIYFSVYFTEEGYENEQGYYEVYFNDELVYTSDDYYFYWALQYGIQDGAETNDEGYMLPGTYTIVVYTLDGDIITSDSIELETESTKPTTPAVPSTGDYTFDPANFGLAADSDVYVTYIDYTDVVLSSFGLTSDDVTGSICFTCFLVLDNDANATLIVDADLYKANVDTFMRTNLDNIVTALTGYTVADYADIQGMTVEEAEEDLMAAFYEGFNTNEVQTQSATNTYVIDGDTITMTRNDGSTIVGTYSSETINITVDASFPLYALLENGELVFQKYA